MKVGFWKSIDLADDARIVRDASSESISHLKGVKNFGYVYTSEKKFAGMIFTIDDQSVRTKPPSDEADDKNVEKSKKQPAKEKGQIVSLNYSEFMQSKEYYGGYDYKNTCRYTRVVGSQSQYLVINHRLHPVPNKFARQYLNCEPDGIIDDLNELPFGVPLTDDAYLGKEGSDYYLVHGGVKRLIMGEKALKACCFDASRAKPIKEELQPAVPILKDPKMRPERNCDLVSKDGKYWLVLWNKRHLYPDAATVERIHGSTKHAKPVLHHTTVEGEDMQDAYL